MDWGRTGILLNLYTVVLGVNVDVTHFTEVFRDDFNVDGPPDRTKWNVAARGSILEGELQYYRKENVYVSNGSMHITTTRDRFRGYNKYNYTSGQVNTQGHFDFQYGEIEWRARSFPYSVVGIWPDLWLYHYQCDPAVPCLREKTGLVEVSAFSNSRTPRLGTEYRLTKEPSFAIWESEDAFHVHKIIWTSEQLIWIVDDKILFNATGKDVPNKRVQMVISVTVGRGIMPPRFNKFPIDFLIDYVVVRQKANITGPDHSPSTPSFVVIPLLGLFGVILVVFLVIAAAYFFWRRRRARNKREQTIFSAASSAVRMSDVHGGETFGEDCEYHYGANDMIGRGTFGIVYTATVTYNCIPPRQEIGALKVVHLNTESHLSTDIESWTRWRNRMQTLILLRHDHLIAYHKINLMKVPGGTNIELLMDYCEIGDLAHLLRKLREEKMFVTETTAIRYAVDITRGVEFLHQKTILHGDLKPGNILAKRIGNGEHRLMVGDLDDLVQLANSTTCSQDISHLRGTVRYMSPEMLLKFSQESTECPGRKTDIWSLGCVILDLIANVTGRHEMWLHKLDTFLPASEMIDSQFIMHIIDGFTPFVPEHAPAGLAACIGQCFCVRPERRISAAQLLTELSLQVASATS